MDPFTADDDLPSGAEAPETWDLVQTIIWIWRRDETAAESVRARWSGCGRSLQDWLGTEAGFLEALEELKPALKSGAVTCSGRMRHAYPLEPIAAIEWSGLQIRDSVQHGPTAWQRGDFERVALGRLPRAFGLSFDKAEIMREWSPHRAAATAAAESKAIAGLAERLRVNPHMTVQGAKDYCKAEHSVSESGAYRRVWPEARKRAGLLPAAAGRKRKS